MSNNIFEHPNIPIEKNDNNIFFLNNNEEITKFVDPDYEIQWKNFLQDSYHFKQDIDRVWAIFRSFDILSILSNQDNNLLIYLKGNDTWKQGNEFKGSILGQFPYVAKVKDSINLPEIKKIEWIIYSQKEYTLISIDLLKVTDDNSTVVVKQIKREKDFPKEISNMVIQMNGDKLYEKIDNILETEPINLLKYESGIINGNMEDIWNIMTDFNQLRIISQKNNYLPNFSFKNMKINEKKEASVSNNETIKKYFITLKYKEEKPGWNKCLIAFEVSGGELVKIPVHTVLYQLTKITNTKCQLTILTKFHEPIGTEIFKEFSNEKRHLLVSVKEYFDKLDSNQNKNSI
jgi:hypothetical protein